MRMRLWGELAGKRDIGQAEAQKARRLYLSGMEDRTKRLPDVAAPVTSRRYRPDALGFLPYDASNKWRKCHRAAPRQRSLTVKVEKARKRRRRKSSRVQFAFFVGGGLIFKFLQRIVESEQQKRGYSGIERHQSPTALMVEAPPRRTKRHQKMPV